MWLKVLTVNQREWNDWEQVDIFLVNSNSIQSISENSSKFQRLGSEEEIVTWDIEYVNGKTHKEVLIDVELEGNSVRRMRDLSYELNRVRQ